MSAGANRVGDLGGFISTFGPTKKPDRRETPTGLKSMEETPREGTVTGQR
jgi:hypothetical protein